MLITRGSVPSKHSSQSNQAGMVLDLVVSAQLPLQQGIYLAHAMWATSLPMLLIRYPTCRGRRHTRS